MKLNKKHFGIDSVNLETLKKLGLPSQAAWLGQIAGESREKTALLHNKAGGAGLWQTSHQTGDIRES